MPSDSTFVEVKNAFQAIAGLESLTAADEFFLTSSLNRAVHRAYNESDSWPRYLVVGEKREIYTYNISGITSGLAAEINQNYKLLGSNSGKNIAGKPILVRLEQMYTKEVQLLQHLYIKKPITLGLLQLGLAVMR